MRRADAFVLRVATRGAHAIQMATGVVSYRIAQQAFVVVVLSTVVDIADYWIPSLTTRPPMPAYDPVINAAVALTWTYASWLAGTAADRFDGVVAPKEALRFAEQFGWFWLRSCCLVMTIAALPRNVAQIVAHPSPFEVAARVDDVVVMIGLYMMLVTPRPPAPQRALVPAESL